MEERTGHTRESATSLRGKRVLITGATRGSGRAAAARFLAAGAAVAVNGRDGPQVQETARALGPERCAAAPGDVSSVAGCTRVVEAAVRTLGGLDVLVNNAGVCREASVEDSDEALWEWTLANNLKSAFFCSRAALPALREGGGAIVNLAADSALVGQQHLAVYSASKGGVVSMTRAMARDLAPAVRVNAVCPGYILNDRYRAEAQASGAPEAYLDALAAYSPLGRLCTPEEVAAAVVFFAGEGGRALTGTILPVDGGGHALGPAIDALMHERGLG